MNDTWLRNKPVLLSNIIKYKCNVIYELTHRLFWIQSYQEFTTIKESIAVTLGLITMWALTLQLEYIVLQGTNLHVNV
jgi:hypothetical protein